MEPSPLNLPFALTPAERKVVAAARAGEIATFSTHTGPPNCDATAAEGQGPVVRAQVLAVLCTDDAAQVHRTGVRLQGALVQGDLDLRWAQLRCPVRLEHCCLPSRVVLADASGKELALDHCTLAKGVEASRLRLDGCLSLVGAVVHGRVVLEHARIGGDLDCAGARLMPPGKVALLADGVNVVADVLLGALDRNEQVVRDANRHQLRFEADGAVRLLGARIGGDLSCGGGCFKNEEGQAISADDADVTGGVLLGLAVDGRGEPVAGPDDAPLRLESKGMVRLLGATIGGQLNCRGGWFTNEGGFALAADRASVTGSVFLDLAVDGGGQPVTDRDGAPLRFEANGAVRLPGATIRGQLSCRGGRFVNRDGDALDADGVNVTGTVFFTSMVGGDGKRVRFEANGTVRLLGASIGGNLYCGGGWFRNGQGIALNGEHLRVTGAFRWREVLLIGRVDLRGASIGTLDDDKISWMQGLGSGLSWRMVRLDGLRYEALSMDAPTQWRDRGSWLERQEVYASQPYRQLAKVYRDAGDDRAARKIAMEQFNAQLGRPDVDLPRRTWLWRWVLRATVGHGYEPWRALYWALAVWAIGWWAVTAAVAAKAMVPAKADAPASARVSPTDCDQPDYSCLVPWLYVADLVFPIVNLGQRDNWRPSGPWKYRAIVPVLVIAGWTLTTFVVAGFTSLVRRE